MRNNPEGKECYLLGVLFIIRSATYKNKKKRRKKFVF